MVPDDLISIKEMCEMIPGKRPGKKLNLATAYSWCQRGKIRSWRVGGSNGHLCVSRADVMALLRPVQPRPELAEQVPGLPEDLALERLREMGMRV